MNFTISTIASSLAAYLGPLFPGVTFYENPNQQGTKAPCMFLQQRYSYIKVKTAGRFLRQIGLDLTCLVDYNLPNMQELYQAAAEQLDTQLMSAAKSSGMWVTSGFKPGDVVIYDWGGDRVPDHCGIVESVSGNMITAIEGNTAVGNDSDGGEVMRRNRSVFQIIGAVRPVYKEEITMDNTPSPAHKEGVEWCQQNGILRGDTSGDLMLTQPVTRQQMCTFMYRLAKYLGKE